MDGLELEGVFWLATRPDNKVAGRLRFDATNGGELDLIGSFHGLAQVGFEQSEKVRIQGIAGQRKLTLDRCLQSNAIVEQPGILRERYYVPVVLTGRHFDDDDPLEFDGFRLQLRHMDHWIWKPSIKIEVTPGENSSGFKQVRIINTPHEKSVFCTDFGELELSFNYKLNVETIVEATTGQSCTLGLQFKELWPLEKVFEVCTMLQNLVTIGVDAPSSITDMSLYRSDLVNNLPNGEVSRDEIRGLHRILDNGRLVRWWRFAGLSGQPLVSLAVRVAEDRGG